MGLSEFSPQGISNIAWALATADMLGKEEACRYLTAAALLAAPRLARFPPQAICNLCWAVCQMIGGRKSGAYSKQKIAQMAANVLAEAAAQQAMHRGSEFSWFDLSGVIVALDHGRQLTCTTNRLATLLVIRATKACHTLNTQVMLNIALSATRLGVQHNILKLLVIQIGACIASRVPRVSPMDLHQWAEVQSKCLALDGSFQSAIGGHPCCRENDEFHSAV